MYKAVGWLHTTDAFIDFITVYRLFHTYTYTFGSAFVQSYLNNNEVNECIGCISTMGLKDGQFCCVQRKRRVLRQVYIPQHRGFSCSLLSSNYYTS